MSKGMEKIQNCFKIIDQRSLRERICILVALIVLLFVAWNQLFLEPSLATRNKLLGESKQISNEIQQLHTEETVTIQSSKADPDMEVRGLIAQMDQELKKIDKQLEGKLIHLLSPQQMPRLLQQLLKEQQSLKLISLENLRPEQMMTSRDDGTSAPLGIYIHALTMELEGKYLKLLQYLQALEQMKQQVFWDMLTIDAKEFPSVKIRLQIHTLSLTEDWIGV